MSGLSRRVFLKGGSAAVVAAGAISAIPGLPALVGTALLARAVPAWVAVLRVLPRGWRHPWRR